MKRNQMKIFFWLIAVVILFLIQQGILAPFNWNLVNPVLVFLVLFSIFGEIKELTILSVIAGLIFDFYSGLPDGIFVLTFVITVFLIRFLLTTLLAREANRLIIVLSVAFGSVAFFLFPFLFNWLLKFMNLSNGFDQTSIAKNLMLSVIYNTIIIIPVYFYYKLVDSLSVKLFHIK